MFEPSLKVRVAACAVSGTIAACGGGNGGEGTLASESDGATAYIDATETGLARGRIGTQPSSKPSPPPDSTTSPTPEPAPDSATSPEPAKVSDVPVVPAPTAETSAPAASGVRTAGGRLGPNELSGLTASGPIVVDGRSGVKITGLRISNPGGPCVIVRGGADIEISGNAIGPCAGNGIIVEDSSRVQVARNNVTEVRNTGINVARSSAVQVRSNYVDRASTAVRAIRSTGVAVELNGAMNIRGPFPDGQLAQFDNVFGGGNRIRCNATNLSVGGPDPNSTPSTPTIRTEDIINTWQSNGLSSDPILIAYNRLQGGGSHTGSGIMSGDGGGSWISVIGNRIVNPWNAGIGVAGGSNIRVERNKVVSLLPKVANEGFYIRNFYPSACTHITHQHNEIKWPATDWSTSGWTQTFWSPNECSNISGTSTNDLDANLSTAIFSEPIAECRQLAGSLGFDPTGW